MLPFLTMALPDGQITCAIFAARYALAPQTPSGFSCTENPDFQTLPVCFERSSP
jgi:hypothetical protein